MKKLLLVSLALCSGFAVMAQNAPGKHLVNLGPKAKTTLKVNRKAEYITEQTLPFSSVYSNPTSTATSRTSNPVNTEAFTASSILNTSYQLSTNASSRNSIVMNSDGTISTANQLSIQSPSTTWTDRGTGYNYYDGSAWQAAPNTRIETVRTGFMNIGVTSSGKEHVFGHQGNGDICYETRATKGTGAWTENQNAVLSPSVGNLWPRMCTGGANGNSLHAISITIPTGITAPQGVKYHGQDGALCYARSTDEGVTWSSWSAPTLLDTSNGYASFNGDEYAIDARGDVIAYVVGGFTTSVTLMKSTDNGTTWTKTVIKAFQIPHFRNQLTDTNNDAVADTLVTNDGSMDVVLDNNNEAHVFFGRMRVIETDTSSAGGLQYFPVTDGLYYWNESMTAPVVLTGCQDIDMDGIINLPTPTPSTDMPFGDYQVSMTSHPSAGVDASGKLWLVYDAIIENTDAGNGHAVRNVYAMGSADGGATWSAPHRIPTSGYGDGVEQVYSGIAPHFTGTCIPVTYMEDLAPGNGIYTQASGNPDPYNTYADIMYGCLAESDVMGTNDIKNNLFNVSDNFPNPFNGNTNITITMTKASRVTIDIYNPLGEKVAATVSSDLSTGEHTMTIDGTKLSAGIYFYTVRAGAFTVTKKMIVQ